MADTETRAERRYEQPDDAMTCYADLSQIVATEHEVIVQFYEPVPGPPHSGSVSNVRMRLRATVILNKQHAARLGAQVVNAARTGSKPAAVPAPKPDAPKPDA